MLVGFSGYRPIVEPFIRGLLYSWACGLYSSLDDGSPGILYLSGLYTCRQVLAFPF